MKKLTKILFLCSFGSFVITLLLEFAQRYNQILFILRHSSLYLGIAFLVSGFISIFYYLYKSIFRKRQIIIVPLNIVTLIVLAISLVWIADSRLEFIAENEVPYYMNEVLYDTFNNRIYESILVGIKPTIEVVENTENKLVLHIEENCDCEQSSNVLGLSYPDEEFDSYIDSSVLIVVDIIVQYNDNNSIDNYTLKETRIITYNLNETQTIHGYVSRKLEIFNEYNTDNLVITQRDYYFADFTDDTEYLNFSSENHYEFVTDDAVTSSYRLNKTLDDDNQVVFILEHQTQDEEIDEMALLHLEEIEDGDTQILFEESKNRPDDGFNIYWGPIKNDLIGSIILRNNQLEYIQEYDQTSVEGGRIGYTEISRTYNLKSDIFVLDSYNIMVDSIDYSPRGLNYYDDIFSTTSYVEIVSRGGTIIENISRLENPLEIDNIRLYEIEHHDFGYSVAYHLDASPFYPYMLHENSNLMHLVDIPPEIDRVDLFVRSDYFNYYSMLFQSSYDHPILFENNEILNFVLEN